MAYSAPLGLQACFRPSTRLAGIARHGTLSFVAPSRLSPRKTWRPPTFETFTFKGSHRRSLPSILAATGIGLGLSSLAITPTLHGDAALSQPPPPENDAVLPPPPQSSVNLTELTFGTVSGVCAGIFVKKGARMLAFFLGGVFVLLQYLRSLSLITVDWARVNSRFENVVYQTDGARREKAPTVGSLLRWLVDFLTADFQPRASFVAGFALGLRLG